MPSTQDFEKLGVFYLGRTYDTAAKRPTGELILYDSSDLVTHAVCVGMTGSGKTGLCLALLEEAAIDGIPAIVIDPKGDLANLLLTFPNLATADFRPWINEDDARKRGQSPDEFSAAQADFWTKGLAEWGQDGARIKRLREAADFAIYTPGSNAGLGVSILRSFAAPGKAITDDGELLRERIATTATSLLGLLGIDADPIQSREHILLSTILGHAWQHGRDADLPSLIRQIQEPPVKRVGVLDVEAFYPAKERFALAMRLNNLLAAPGFGAWLEGEPLDIGAMLHCPAGRPRVAIFSVAHLGDAERMFFISLLLNEVLGWTRQQPGTTSLRAIVYMDEIVGYFPPTANPPSKAPLLLMMKQARAFGVGMVLSTQNPVDLDYKGLANAGTWFIGRLQTERDKARLIDGLEGARAGADGVQFDRAAMERTLAGLGKRQFLMNNVHDEAPVVFDSRWAMSYLRGPLTRGQIKLLMDPVKASMSQRTTLPTEPRGAPQAAEVPAPARAATSLTLTGASSVGPVLPPEIAQFYVPVRGEAPAGASLAYRPMLLGCGSIYFTDAKRGVDQQEQVRLLAPLREAPAGVDWQGATKVSFDESALTRAPTAGAVFAPLPAAAAKVRSYGPWTKQFADALYHGESIQLMRSAAFSLVSRPGESDLDFRLRLSMAARERLDGQKQTLRKRYEPKADALRERLRRAAQAVDRERGQASASTWGTAISIGSTVLGAVLGRKRVSAGNVGRAATAARGASRSYKESRDVARAAETAGALRHRLAELEAQFQEEIRQMQHNSAVLQEPLERVTIKLKKVNIAVRPVVLAWAPYWHVGAIATAAY